jgi:C4-dicarboxylate-specific signal transduction histidine kinase
LIRAYASRGRRDRSLASALLLGALFLIGAPAPAAAAHEVLVIYSNGRLLPANIAVDRGLVAEFESRPDLQVEFATEFFDWERFSSDGYEDTFAAYVRDKYASRMPDVIIAGGNEALGFLVRRRAGLFPHVPVVHVSVESRYVDAMSPLPADVLGTPITYDFAATAEQALRWHPTTKRLVVVTGAGPWDREMEAVLRTQLAGIPGRPSIEFLSALPMADLQQRLRQLPPDTVVLTPGFFRDGGGQEFVPRESTRLVAAASASPVYSVFTTFLGTGIVGGRMGSYEEMARQAARIAIELLEGAAPGSMMLPVSTPTRLEVDWRELRRWGISPRAVPADAILHFREPTIWEAYRSQVLLAGAVLLLQAGLIFALLLERRRRRRTVAALERSERHMRLAAQAASLSYWELDYGTAGPPDDRDAAQRSGPQAGPLVDFRETIARASPQDAEVVSAALRDALEGNGDFHAEYRVEAPEGGWRWHAARGRVEQADVPRLLGVAIDITERKEVEIQAERDRAALYHMTRVSLLGQLSASIAHQLNQPLASILANAEAAQKMLEREPVDTVEMRGICADIVAEDHRAAQVIRRLGVLFRRGDPLFEPIDLNELLRDTIELTRNLLTQRQATLETEFAADLPQVAGDRVQLQQLVLNLIVNGAEAVAGCPEASRVLQLRTEACEGHVRFCLTDRGPGISADALARMFEPFWTTKVDGMGMGLAICRSIAEAHRGSLTATNGPSGGAVFCLQLPALDVP